MPTGSSETVKHASSAAGRPDPTRRLKNLKISPLVPGFTNAAGFSGSPWKSNPPEILSPTLLDFPSLALSPVVCARCHNLRSYGKVKDQTVENLLPDFDFDHTVGRRLNLVTGTRVVVVMVADAIDFPQKLQSWFRTQSMSILELGKRGNRGICLI
ncbi:hypothetical protein L1987_35227 [Smallanthus sonchifolius]|uniref:Uncharacterized protein n=1 Tax=Smallanthus sonchifolius TaxID=185202 RepID=A0ACB9HWH9_9ASTR|nr:hypothetical protein L1987_35227 [Smallanthus sonchifolius]